MEFIPPIRSRMGMGCFQDVLGAVFIGEGSTCGFYDHLQYTWRILQARTEQQPEFCTKSIAGWQAHQIYQFVSGLLQATPMLPSHPMADRSGREVKAG